MIHAQIDSVGATAAALDLALFSRVSSKLQLGLRMANMGTSLTFLEEGDPLPFGVYAGGAYRMNNRWMYTSELVYRRVGPLSWHLGAEWKPYSFFMVRSGFKTDALQQLSYLTGLSIGFGFSKWGHEIAYAWVPFGRLGHTHYFSLHLRLGKVIVRNDGERPHVLQPVESTEDWWLPKDSK